jgi:hypothetical protein
VQEDACHRLMEQAARTPWRPSDLSHYWAQSLRWDYVGRLPPASRLCYALHSRAARGKTPHPIDSFDKTGQRTLETFDSLAVRMDYAASERRND